MINNNNFLAIDSIKTMAKEKDWDHGSQVIITCEFITSLDKDKEFQEFLEEKVDK